MGPPPAVAAVRLAVRKCLDQLAPQSVVLAACSGGADSTALAAALAFEAPRSGLKLTAGAVTVDHGLQAGAAARAAAVVRLLRELGLDPLESVAVEVAGSGGPEAAARDARYAALDAVADRLGGATILLGHTLDDQAETVLLGLARGSGVRSLAGMPATKGKADRYRRPLLGLSRATTRAACAEAGLPVWDDPHNADPSYARARVRTEVMPVLEAALGPGVAAALARTAQLARDDADALEAWAAMAHAELCGAAGSFDADELRRLPVAVRSRVLRQAALSAGAMQGALAAGQIAAVDALVTDWRGQGSVSLPGGLVASRRYGRLYIERRSEGEAGEGDRNKSRDTAGG
ncbi:MAG: tRNA lysidine(34) synthetase TilS [Acidothermaceae bacterium]